MELHMCLIYIIIQYVTNTIPTSIAASVYVCCDIKLDDKQVTLTSVGKDVLELKSKP